MDKTAELSRFRDYLRFGSDEEPPKGDRSTAAYLYTLGRFLDFVDGQEPGRETVLAFAKHLLDEGNAPSSVNRHIAALKAWFRSKGEELRLRGLKTEEKQPGWLDEREVQQIQVNISEPLRNKERPDIARVKARLERAIFFLYVGAAIRLSEGCELLRTDVDPQGYIKVHGKGGRVETVPIEDSVLQVIREYLADRTDDNPYLFRGKLPGSHISARYMYQLIRDMGQRAGVKLHPHMLRHTAATAMLSAGVDSMDVKDVLRHRDISSTQIYTHILKEELRTRLPQRLVGSTLPMGFDK